MLIFKYIIIVCAYITTTKPNVTKPNWTNFFLFLVLISNDVELNPGPDKYMDYIDYEKQIVRYDKMMKFCLLNARNITGKRLEFQDLVKDHGQNCIFAVTETWLNNDDTPATFAVDSTHFKVFSANRYFTANRAKGGGVLLLIPKYLNPKLRSDISELCDTFESLWVECKSPCEPNKNILINVSYCPHKHLVDCFFDQLAADVSAAYNEGKEVYLFGDYNCNYLQKPEAEKINALLSNLDLHIVNTDTPTRIGDNSKTLIDHFFCGNPRKFHYRVTEPNFPTDHCLTTYICNTEVKRTSVAKSYFTFL